MDQEKYNRKIELSKAVSAQNANKQIDSKNDHESRKTKNEPRRIFPKQHAIADKIKRAQKLEEKCEEDASGQAEEKEELSPRDIYRRKTGQEAVVSNEMAAAEANAEGGSHQDTDTTPDPPPNPRPALAQVLGKWASSVRRISGDRDGPVQQISGHRNTVTKENVVEILDAEVVQVISDPPNKRKTIYLGIALVVAVAVIGGAFWFTQSTASQTLLPTLRPTAYPTPTKIDQLFCGESILGDTTTEEKNEVESCGDVGYKTKSPGNKYFFEGDGNFILMSTCHEVTKGTSNSNFYDSRIRVFRANTETSEEECVVGNKDDAGCDIWNKASTVQFQSKLNVLYAVYVDGPRTSGGLFELSVSCVDAPSVSPSVAPTRENVFGFSEYKFVKERYTYEEHSVAARIWGGHLTSILSQEENDFIEKRMLLKGFDSSIWIGGEKDLEGRWTWVDGSPFTFKNWQVGEPNNTGGDENNIMFYNSFKWNDVNINNPKAYKMQAIYKKDLP